MKRKPGILFVVNDFNVGGAEVFILRLGKEMSKDYNVYITEIQDYNNNIEFKNRFLKGGFTHIPKKHSFSPFVDFFLWKMNALFSKFGYLKFYNSVKFNYDKKYWIKNFTKNSISIVNSHLLSSDLFVLHELSQFKLKLNFKWVITMHSSYNMSNLSHLSIDEKKRNLEQAYNVFKSADALVCVADLNKEIFANFNEISPPTKIYLGYDPDEIDEDKEKDFSYLSKHFTFSMVARGIMEKGWEIAIEAFIKCLNYHDDIRLVLICPLTDYIISLKDKYKHIKQIIFTDFLKSPVSVLKYTKVGLLPSYYSESLPYFIIECLGNNVPVITSDRGELEGMIKERDKFAGIILKNDQNNKPCIKELEKSMLELIDNFERYKELKMNTKIVFDKFSIRKCSEKYSQIFTN